MVKILVCGNYGATNHGDEAILDGIIEVFRSMDSNFVFEAMGPGAKAITEVHGLNAYDLFPCGVRSIIRGLLSGSVWKTIDGVRKTDVFVLGGGGLFTDEKLMAVIIWSMQVNLVRLLHKPYICLGQSVGPLRTSFGRHVARKVFKSSHLNIVRDDYSAHLLKTMGIDGIRSLSDCAFMLHPPSVNEDEDNPYIVMTVRPWFSQGEKSFKIFADFIKYVHRKHGLKTVLVPFQILKDDDRTVLGKIYDLVEDKNMVELKEYDSDYRNVMKLISGAKATVGMRLHSLIFSALTRKPFISISYSTKVEGFVNQMAMSDYLIHWNELEFSLLQRKFDSLIGKRSRIIDVIEEKSIIQRNKVCEYSTLIGQIINIRK